MCAVVSQGLICYKPVDQESCFLQQMDETDYDNVHSLLHEPTRKVTSINISTRGHVILKGFPQCLLDM